MKNKTISILVMATFFLTSCGGIAAETPTLEPAPAQTVPETVTAEGILLPENSAELAFAQGGVVKEILIHPGEKAAAGDVLVRLIGAESAQAELAAAKLEQTVAQQALDAIHRNSLLTSSQSEQALHDAQEAYESEASRWTLNDEDKATNLELSIDDYVAAEKDYRNKRDKLDDLLYLDKDDHKRMDAQEDFDKEKASLAEAYLKLKAATAENVKTLDEDLTALLGSISALETARELQSRMDESNLDPEILAAAKARLEAANAHVAAAKANLELYELRAPFNADLLRLDPAIGEVAPPMTPIAFIADASHWIIETKDLAEVDVANVAVGDPVTVRLDAFPDEEFTGKVTKIDPVGRLHLGDMTYQITIALDEADPRFLWNMTAVISVDAEKK